MILDKEIEAEITRVVTKIEETELFEKELSENICSCASYLAWMHAFKSNTSDYPYEY